MESPVESVTQYISLLPKERQVPFRELRKVIQQNIPSGFTETISYGIPAYVVPHALYPSGYHCNPALPLPFISIASQKNAISFYHMGMYANPPLLDWFTHKYAQLSHVKLEIGKSCIRFKKMDQIPYLLIGRFVKKMTVNDWISLYEAQRKK